MKNINFWEIKKNIRKINKNCCKKWNIKNLEEYEKTYKKIIKKFEENE